MGLMTEAFKRVAAIKLAEFMSMYAEEVERRRKREEEEEKETHLDDESATHTHLDFENPDLLDGAIVARRFGFGLPDSPVVNRTGDKVQDNR